MNADDKRRARLNCISHLLSLIPYKEIKREEVKLPKRQKPHGYVEPKNRPYSKFLKCFDSHQTMRYSEERTADPSGLKTEEDKGCLD